MNAQDENAILKDGVASMILKLSTNTSELEYLRTVVDTHRFMTIPALICGFGVMVKIDFWLGFLAVIFIYAIGAARMHRAKSKMIREMGQTMEMHIMGSKL